MILVDLNKLYIVCLSDPPFQKGNARFNTVPFKPLSDQQFQDIVVFLAYKKCYFSDNFNKSFVAKSVGHFYKENAIENNQKLMNYIAEISIISIFKKNIKKAIKAGYCF